MAENSAEMPVAKTMVTHTRARRAWNPLQWAAIFGVIEAVLAVALITGVAMHHRGVSNPSAPVVSRTISSQQTRLLENNTTNLPNAVTADVRPVVIPRAQQRFMEVNTMLPDAAGTSNNYMEEVTPRIGYPR